MAKNLEYYLHLPYTRELIPDPVVGWGVNIKELPGCMSQGETKEEALENIEEALRGWLEVELEEGNPIPEPRGEEEYSGKFVVRVPRSMHRRLVDLAGAEDTSLNQIIVSLLAGGIAQADTQHKLSGLAYEIRELKAVLESLIEAERINPGIQATPLPEKHDLFKSIFPDAAIGRDVEYLAGAGSKFMGELARK